MCGTRNDEVEADRIQTALDRHTTAAQRPIPSLLPNDSNVWAKQRSGPRFSAGTIPWKTPLAFGGAILITMVPGYFFYFFLLIGFFYYTAQAFAGCVLSR